MSEKLDGEQVNRLVLEFIKDELREDYDIDVASDRLWKLNIIEREDGGVNCTFEYFYDEESQPWDEYSAGVFFRGSMQFSPKGEIVAKLLSMTSKEIRATGPIAFLTRHARDPDTRRSEKGGLIKWEDTLKIGDLVNARFILNSVHFEFFSYIAKINPKSFRVTPAIDNSDFKGKEFLVPRRRSSTFSESSGVFPLDADAASK